MCVGEQEQRWNKPQNRTAKTKQKLQILQKKQILSNVYTIYMALTFWEHQPDPHHNYEIFFKWSSDVFIKIKFCFTSRSQMCLQLFNIKKLTSALAIKLRNY